MQENNALFFKISAALKNLIGKELITDQYIAIFELVKNSFDAHATEVEIIFEKIYDKDNSKIVIKDNGKGMDYDDLKNKWLFVAYSAKKDGTEDDKYEKAKYNENTDYREKIKTKRVFAGAKGVGRFSCDRLGRNLNLITIKDAKGAFIENLKINWDDFEGDTKEEFINVPVNHSVLRESGYNINHGTILEITGLRDNWNRDTILKLKRSLEKLINPNQENDSDNFIIKITSVDELKTDELCKEERDKVNGIIKNTIFEKLNLKTTQIESKISEDGSIITTTLRDRGKLIYKVKERNPYSIANINIHLFQLNFAAKYNFKLIMGIQPVQYGSVFIYKNGFRIYPYGEQGEDFLGIDRRKAQGHNRFLGTRDLIGRVEINGDNDEFKESTSRDGGLIKNRSYDELVHFFYSKVLRRLELYVVQIIRWGDPYEDESGEKKSALNPEDVKAEILRIIEKLTKSNEIISIEYDNDFLSIIGDAQKKSVNNILKNLSKQALKSNDSEMKKEVEVAQRQFISLLETVNIQDKIIEEKDEKILQVSSELDKTSKQVLFLKSITAHEVTNLVNLFHQTGISANTIDNYLIYFNEKLNKGLLINNADIRHLLQKVSFENRKIQQISNFVTRDNLVLISQEVTDDLIEFINQYVNELQKHYSYNDLRVHLDIQVKERFKTKFKPIEITIIIDNLISNSKKANAKSIDICIVKISEQILRIIYKDDGQGLHKSITNPEKIFEIGYTTTSGSGLGLNHIVEILSEMNGKIEINPNVKKGIEFIIEVKI